MHYIVYRVGTYTSCECRRRLIFELWRSKAFPKFLRVSETVRSTWAYIITITLTMYVMKSKSRIQQFKISILFSLPNRISIKLVSGYLTRDRVKTSTKTPLKVFPLCSFVTRHACIMFHFFSELVNF